MINFWKDLNKKQRLQTKLFFSILGALLLLILLIGRILAGSHGGEGEPQGGGETEPIHIPEVELLKNVWIMEMDESGLLVFCEGEEYQYAYESDELAEQYAPFYEADREQVADVTLTDGRVSRVDVKMEKLNGKLLRADETGIWVEGHGKLEFAEDCRGYRLYRTLSMCTYRDLLFGYDYTDLVLEDGKVCAMLMAEEEAMETIRVLLKASDYTGITHEEVTLTADTDFTVTYEQNGEEKQEHYAPGDLLVLDDESDVLESGRAVVTADVQTGRLILESAHRSQGVPRYRGSIELLRTPEGIVAVNEVKLEEYLYCVLPSEMPASYPEEALKAQAICARTYAYGHMQKAGYPQYGAHVDDSTAYQVYNNIIEQASTTKAVKETFGQLLFTDRGECAETFYYSTSCGVGSDANVWKTESAAAIDYLAAKGINRSAMRESVEAGSGETERAGKGSGEAERAGTGSAETGDIEVEKTAERILDGASDLGERMQDEETFRAYITSVYPEDFEADEAWYRWEYQVKKLDVSHLYEILQKRCQANDKLVLVLKDGEFISGSIKEFTEVRDLFVAKRGVGGVADELVIETDRQTIKVITEHNIRWVLDDGVSKVTCQDGRQAEFPNLLPSAFFAIEVGREGGNVVGYTLFGGGYGHGVGMSQNAAKSMAKSGYTAEQILHFFYENCSVQSVEQARDALR